MLDDFKIIDLEIAGAISHETDSLQGPIADVDTPGGTGVCHGVSSAGSGVGQGCPKPQGGANL
jgi:hypothetical protein